MSDDGQQVRRIAIFGQSHELWPVAALLVKNLPAATKLIAVEDSDVVDPAAVTVRLDDPLLVRLGISAEELRAANSAIFALGTELRDWLHHGSRFFATGSGSLPEIGDIAIHQLMLRAALIYDQPDRLAYLYQPFRLPARAAEAGKFALQSSDPRSPLSMLRPTVQLDRADYVALFRNRLPSGRVNRFTAHPTAVLVAADGETINRVELDNGNVVDADLFIDVSGAVGDVAKLKSQADWHSISDGFPFDRLLATETTDDPGKADRHGVARAIKGGVLITTPLRETSITQLVCASSVMSGEAPQDLAKFEGNATALEPGYSAQPWIGNLVQLGTASSCFGPFLSADTMMLHRQAALFTDHLPARLEMTVEASREDAPWAGLRGRTFAESLAIRIDQFRSRGRFVAFESEICDEQSWIDMMIGFGVVPGRVDPMAQSLDMTTMSRRLKNLTTAFDQALAAMPLYRDAFDGSGADALP